jgi:hypothetical protein
VRKSSILLVILQAIIVVIGVYALIRPGKKLNEKQKKDIVALFNDNALVGEAAEEIPINNNVNIYIDGSFSMKGFVSNDKKKDSEYVKMLKLLNSVVGG